MFRILAISAALLGLASVAQADVYRWTDANGIVQYSDKWVPGSVLVKADKNHVAAPTPSASQADSSSAVSNPDEVVTDQQNQRAVEADVAKSKAEQCKKARADYDKAIASRRMYKEGANGAKEYVSDAEADAYRRELLNERKLACGS
ncbi:MAG: DUF4124 domain-containing protein [Gammaproteobacteria bacterium]